MMKRRHALIVLILLVPALTPVSGQILDRPVATVRLTETVPVGQRTLRSQIEFLEAQYGRTLTAEERRDVLDAAIDDELLNQGAARDGVTVPDSDVAQAIQSQRASLGTAMSDAEFRVRIERETGLTWEAYRSQIRKRLVQEQYVVSRSREIFAAVEEPTSREVRRFYEENAPEFTSPAMVRFDHLFFDTRAKTAEEQQAIRRQATQTASSIRAGRTGFDDELDRSLDDVAVSGGDFGYLVRGDQQAIRQLGRTFVDEIFEMEEGDISGVLSSNVGYHIVRIRDRRSPRLLGLDDPILPGESVTVRTQVVAYLRAQKQQEAFQRALEATIDELRDQAEIDIFEDNLDW